jgi:hypothetical protein
MRSYSVPYGCSGEDAGGLGVAFVPGGVAVTGFPGAAELGVAVPTVGTGATAGSAFF